MWQQAAPENGPWMMQVYRAAVSISLEQSRWAKIHAGLCAGAACCQPVQLPHYKAAPLQALGMRRHVPYENENDSAIIQCAS
jgi:hypothetical protein